MDTPITQSNPSDLLSILIPLFAQIRFNLNNEKALQDEIEAVLQTHRMEYQREYPLHPHGIVDFFIDGLAVEVKLQGTKKSIYRQCRKYCRHHAVNGLLLLTNISVGMPDTIDDKPCFVFSLGIAHL